MEVTLAALIGTAATAQDTVYSNGPDTTKYLAMLHWWWDTNRISGYETTEINGFGGDMARAWYTEDTLVIYGIAGSLVTDKVLWPDRYSEFVEDTSSDKCREAMRLYAYDSVNQDLIQLGEDLWVQVGVTPVNYYQKMGQLVGRDDLYGGNPRYIPAFPVYERYFNEPQVVVGRFFVGYTQNTGLHSEPYGSSPYSLLHFVVTPMTFAYSPGFMVIDATQFPDNNNNFFWHITPVHFDMLDHFLFPILTPNPDTASSSDGDTLAVESSRMIERSVAVSPNPATGQVRVVSSVGLNQVEAFDAAGHPLLSEKASGMTFRFNVKSWPRGTYLLRIATPMGPVTKKLIVQ